MEVHLLSVIVWIVVSLDQAVETLHQPFLNKHPVSQ